MNKKNFQVYSTHNKTLILTNKIPQKTSGIFINYIHNQTKGIIFSELNEETYNLIYAKHHSKIIKLYGELFNIGKLSENHLDILRKLNQIGFELKGAGVFNSQDQYIILKERNSSNLGKLSPKLEDLKFIEKITHQKIIIN